MDRLLVLTDRRSCPGRLPDAVAAAVSFGARAVVLREKDLPPAERARLAEELCEILDPVGGRLILAGPAGPHGVQLAARDPFPTPRPGLVGRSCHDGAELAAARAEGCDYVTLSPIFLTASKPGYGPALGTAALASLIRSLTAPTSASRRDRPPPAVYALGGVLPGHVAACLAAGARGIATMGPVMREPRLVVDYLARLSVARPAVPPEVSA